MLIEVHCGSTTNMVEGSLRGIVGKKRNLEFAYQVEEVLQDIFSDKYDTQRAFVLTGDTVFSVLGRDKNGKPTYVGKSDSYQGKWDLPSMHVGRSTIATLFLTQSPIAWEDVRVWADRELLHKHSACAIALDKEGVLYAWELDEDGKVAITARGYRETQIPVPQMSDIQVRIAF